MLTLDEALSRHVIEVNGDEAAAHETVAARAAEIISRYESLAAEVDANDKFQHILWRTMLEISTGRRRPADVLLSVFMTGLITGIEMTKTDGGIVYEPDEKK